MPAALFVILGLVFAGLMLGAMAKDRRRRGE